MKTQIKKNDTQFKGAVISLAAWMTLIPVVFLFFNFVFDPYRRFHLEVTDQDLISLSRGAGVIDVQHTYNDRILLKRYLAVLPSLSSVIFGGSRIMNIGLEPADPGKLLNAGVTNGTIRDYVGIWEYMKENGKIPQTAVICLEPQAVYHNMRNDLWYTMAPYYFHFMKGKFKKSFYFKQLRKGMKQGMEFYLSYLLSSDTFGLSYEKLMGSDFMEIIAASAPPDRPVRDASLALLRPNFSTWTPERVLEAARNNGAGEARFLSEWSNFSDSTFKEIEEWFKDMQAQGVRIVVVIPPSHPESLQKVLDHPAAYENLKRFIQQLRVLSDQHGGQLFDGIDEHRDWVRGEDFWDGVHLHREDNRTFFKKMDQTLGLGIFTDNSPKR